MTLTDQINDYIKRNKEKLKGFENIIKREWERFLRRIDYKWMLWNHPLRCGEKEK